MKEQVVRFVSSISSNDIFIWLIRLKVSKLSLCEINSLSQKEFEKMITNSESLHSKIFLLQNEIEKKQEHILECENVTEEQKKVLQEFLNFIPNKKNVKIDYSTQKNDNK